MACSRATVKILQCLVVLLVFFAASTQGRVLRRIHNGHRVGSKSLAEIQMDREMLEDLETSVPFRHSRRKHSRHRATLLDDQVVGDNDEGRAEYQGNSEYRESYLRGLPWSLERLHAVRKRHNANGDEIAYEIMSRDEELDYQKSRARSIHHRGTGNGFDTVRNKRYEVEVKEAQNSSLCNYTVVDIPDPSFDKSRKPKNLVNVMCNHAGSRCRDIGTYCCIQTYSKIEVSYGDGTTEAIKIYTGCVCSLRLYGELRQYKPRVLIDD